MTGPGSGTAKAAQNGTAPLHLAKKDVLESPKNRVTGTGSGTAGDALPKTAPLQKSLAKDNPFLKADSDVRVVIRKKSHYLALANYAQQLPPKAADEPLSFCTHKEKGHRNDPQARSEQQPTGTRAYQPTDSAVRGRIPPP